MEQEKLASRLWDVKYRKGRYDGGSQVGFVEKIISMLQLQGGTHSTRGLYVGCGSGRNYVPLADAGMDGLRETDQSAATIKKLSERRPNLAPRIEAAGFENVQHIPAVSAKQNMLKIKRKQKPSAIEARSNPA